MDASNITLRGYQPSDIDALYALDVVCFEEPFRFTRAAMRGFATSLRAQVVIAEEAGVVVGFCIAHVERIRAQRVGYIVTLDVAPSHRRRGLARRMMQAIEAACIAQRCDVLALHVYVANEAAIGFYQRCGFVFVMLVPDFYGVGLNAAVWHKQIEVHSQQDAVEL
jgi:ribosomal-protein-alanine N-acetyltransferase